MGKFSLNGKATEVKTIVLIPNIGKKETKIAIVNKYYTTEGKVNCLIDILKSIELDTSAMNEKNISLLAELSQTKLEL